MIKAFKFAVQAIFSLLEKIPVVFFDIHCVFNIMSKTTIMPRGDDPKASWVIHHISPHVNIVNKI
jgi:hypothetical protein